MSSANKPMRHVSPATKAIVTFGVITFLAFVLPIKKVPVDVGNILAATSIFYSILLGFYIASAMTNLSRLKTLIATETGALISIYRIAKLSLPNRADKVRDGIDNYLIKRFDYEVDEYVEQTSDEFFAIFDVLKGAKTKSEGEAAALNYVAEGMYYVTQAQREVTIVGAKIVTTSSWLVLGVLSLIIVFCLFIGRDGTWESAVTAAFLSASAIMSLFILSDVDGNRFGEDQFAINTYQDVFDAIGRPHYYPTLYIEQGRYKPPVKHYRTGSSGHVHMNDAKPN